MVRKFLKTFFSSIKSNTLGRFFNFFQFQLQLSLIFNSSETSQNLFDKLINVFPKSCYLEKKIDKKKFSLYLKKKFKEKYKNPLDFFLNLKSIGANINLNKTKTNIFFLRRMKSEIVINYNVSFFFIKKIEPK